jgi:hypothetical protein
MLSGGDEIEGTASSAGTGLEDAETILSGTLNDSKGGLAELFTGA